MSSCSSVLEKVILDEILFLHNDSNIPDQTVESLKLQVLKRILDILKLPISTEDLILSRQVMESRIVLSQANLSALDYSWNKIMMMSSDYRISNMDKIIRETVISSRLHVDKKILVKFIGILLKKDVIYIDREDDVLKSNVLNILLAVDGFSGVLPRHYKNYVDNLNDELPERVKKHIFAVQTIYKNYKDFIFHPQLLLFTGTAMTCLVFLSLLNLYKERVGHRIDDCTLLVLNNSQKFVEKFMAAVIPNKNDDMYLKYQSTCRKIYCEYFNHDDQLLLLLDNIAFEKLVEFGNNTHKYFTTAKI